MSLSVIILTKNEAANIAQCIQSTQGLADEIVVFDSRSDDATAAIAQKLGAKVFQGKGSEGWGQKRQEAQSLTTGDWILHLDADERLTPGLIEELKKHLSEAKGTEIFAIARANHLFSSPIRHCGWYPDYVLRCYKKDHTSYNDAKVHEHVEVKQDSKVIYLKEPMLHYTYRDLEQCLTKQRNYALAFAREKHAKGKKVSLWTVGLRGLFSFIRVYIIRKGFLDGRWGLWNAFSTSTYTMNKYLALYVKQQGKPLSQSDLAEKNGKAQ